MKNFTLGIFLGCDLSEVHRTRIENFCETHASIFLLDTESFQLHAFVDTLNEEELSEDWVNTYGSSDGLIFFERVNSPSSWCAKLEQSLPARIKICANYYLSR